MIGLIVGFGSIGKRHAKILNKLKIFDKLYVITGQMLPKYLKKCNKINEIKKINPDYIVIASETNKHFKHLKYINSRLNKKKILVEKPLYNKINTLNKINNNIFIGYNLRFHPVIQKVKKLIKGKKIYSIKSVCFSNLKHWRKNRNYSLTSSAKKKSGGVILDLSHEFDFISWMIGKLSYLDSIKRKNSDLKIYTEDYLSLNAVIKKKIQVHFNFNYYSKIETRKIFIDGQNISLIADLINNNLVYRLGKKLKKFSFRKFKIDDTFIKLHNSLIKNKIKDLCTYNDGLQIVKFIDQVKK